MRALVNDRTAFNNQGVISVLILIIFSSVLIFNCSYKCTNIR